jgi:hypothetical protein
MARAEMGEARREAKRATDPGSGNHSGLAKCQSGSPVKRGQLTPLKLSNDGMDGVDPYA